jgi:hypothetical protein
MDFEPLPVDDDAFDEQAEDCLPGVETGLEELGSQRLCDLTRPCRPRACDFRFQPVGLELGQGGLCTAAALFDGSDPAAEYVQRKSARLVGVRQPVALTVQLLEASLGLVQAWVRFRDTGTRSFDPG